MLDELLTQLKRRKKEPAPADDPPLSTQAPPASAESRLLQARAAFAAEPQVRIAEVKQSEALQVRGLVLGTVAEVLAPGPVVHLLLADETGEMFCSVHPAAVKDAPLQKDDVLVADSPAVWRIPYAKYTPCLNVVKIRSG